MGPSDSPRSNSGPLKMEAHVIVEPGFTHYTKFSVQVGAVIRYWKGSAYKVRKGSAYKVQWCFFYRKFRKMTAIRYSGVFLPKVFVSLCL